MENNFKYAFYQLNLIYGIEMNEDEFEEIGLIAWNFIGNKRVRLYKCELDVDTETCVAKLPCNCDKIIAVTYPFEDWKSFDGYSPNGNFASQYTENYIEARKEYKDPQYLGGKYVKYELLPDNEIIVNEPIEKIRVLYSGIIMDEDGLPFINDKESIAIADYVAYTFFKKKYYVTQNKGSYDRATLAKTDWMKHCDNARVPESISQNDMNEVLDVMASYNRKIFNKSYKPFK